MVYKEELVYDFVKYYQLFKFPSAVITVHITGEIVVSSRLNKFSQARVTLSDMTTDKTMCATSCRFSWCETGFRAKRY